MLATTFESSIVGQLFDEVLFVAFGAFSVCAWNSFLIEGFDDFLGIHHAPLFELPHYAALRLPLVPFQLSSSALGLLSGRC